MCATESELAMALQDWTAEHLSHMRLSRPLACWLIISALPGLSSTLSAARRENTDYSQQNPKKSKSLVYTDKKYGFRFKLPESWRGYTVAVSEWQGGDPTYQTGEETSIPENGPLITIEDPRSTESNPRQNIPIMVFTKRQWHLIEESKLIVSAAPFGPSELGMNARYIFALPPRYNYAFIDGWEEVDKIIQSQPLQAF
jgi:hypothetical protein